MKFKPLNIVWINGHCIHMDYAFLSVDAFLLIGEFFIFYFLFG